MSKARSLADLISGGATIEASEIADSTITGGKLASDITINTTGTVTTTKISGPSYTNLTNYSEEFDNSFWVKSRASISANAIIAPNGTTTADSLIESTDNNNTHYVNKSISSMVTLADGDKITLSVYAKAGTRDHLFLSFNWATFAAVSIFDLSDGTISNTSSKHDNVVMEDVGEGWYRCSITDTHNTNNTAETFRCDIGIASGDTTFSYTGDGSSNIYIWGASFSLSDRPISYIKTVASSAAETEAYVETKNFNVNSGALYIDTDNRKVGIGTSTPSSTLDVNGTVTATTFAGALTGDVTGNADTATALETARTIGGVSFDGTANINLPGVNTSGNQDTSGNAATATALETARTIAGQSFDGTANITIAATDLSDTDQSLSTTDNVTFNDLTVSGNLTVSGTTTTVNTETINLADNTITLNSNETGTPSQDGGIEIERGTSTNKTLVWNETTDKWTVGSETFVAGTFEGALTGNVTGNVTGDLTGNADTATALATARTIAGQSFNGTANISIAPTDLTGVTATATEINYVDGVTSAIQTQLDTKATTNFAIAQAIALG